MSMEQNEVNRFCLQNNSVQNNVQNSCDDVGRHRVCENNILHAFEVRCLSFSVLKAYGGMFSRIRSDIIYMEQMYTLFVRK